MRRPTALLCCLAFIAAPALVREPGARVIYRIPAGPPSATLWTQHPVLSLPTPMLTVSDRDTTDGGTTREFFARLADLGFHCLTSEPPRRRIRRAEAVCSRADGEEWSSYAGGWPEGGGVFVVDRIRIGRGGAAELLGGVKVGAHVRGVLGDGEPPRAMTMRNMAVR